LTKNLILLCDNYPIGLGEFFLDDEIKIAETYFDKIMVIVTKEQYQSFDHYTSDKLVVYEWAYQLNLSLILRSLPFIFSSNTFRELFRMRKQAGLKNIIKIVVNDALKSSNLMNQVRTVLTKEQLNPKESVFYSYWHDFKALALARLKQKIKGTFISRAHSSDIFAFRSAFNYLPYKRFILSNLDQTYSVSDIGKAELEKYIEEKDIEKVSVSRLGKQNLRAPLFEKTDDKIIICSCSHFNHLKRVHLIPRILKKVNIPNIHWVHFGWGYPEYENMVHDELQYARYSFELKGETENENILDFYSTNFVDLFINLSTHEGIPVSIMEAFSAAIPVLATNVGGVGEIVDENCGFIIEKEFNVDLVAKKLEVFLKATLQIQTEKRRNARLQWEKKYNAEKNYHDFYKQLVINGN
jgi:glycosyltransferase involved in cell wall biosynthesis